MGSPTYDVLVNLRSVLAVTAAALLLTSCSTDEVKKAVSKTKKGTQRSGKSGKAKTKKQAIAIGLSKARKKGAKVPPKKKG